MPDPMLTEQALQNAAIDRTRVFHVSSLQQDAANLRVSAVGFSNTDAGQNRVSAIQGDAANLMMSAKSGDAGLLRISAIGGTAGDNVVVDGSDQTVSARIKQISAVLSASDNAFIVHTVSEGAHRNRVSAIQDGAAALNVSAKSNDGALLRTSAIQDGAAALNVSAKSNDGALLRTSAVQDGAAALNISAKSNDGALMRVSALQGDAANLLVSAKAIADARAAGGLTVFSTSAGIAQVSTVKSSGGRLYGWYIGNPAGVDQYLQLFNVTGGATLGTDVPYMTFYVPTLGAANLLGSPGIGFATGIQAAVTSTAAGNTAGASAMRVNLWYA